MSKGNRGGPAMYGHDLFGDAVEVARGGALSERFLVPPFSLLDARDGWWRERKRGWLAFGIESEIGRADNLLGLGNAVRTFDHFREQSGEKKPKMAETLTGTSVFDPVLCELAYRWFSPADGQVLDPFAGGSVRGIIAAMLGREYRGVDLREEQIEANIAQAGLILGLVTMAGTLPIRASASMRTTRKLGKTHQNVLIFLKGDAKRAAQAMAPVNDTDGDIATVDGDSAEEPAE